MNPDQTPAPEAAITAPDATPAPANPASYESNPFKLIKPSFEAFKRSWANVLLAALAMVGIFLVPIILFALVNFTGLNSVAGLGVALNVILFLFGAVAVIYVPMYFSWALYKISLAAARGHRLPLRESLPARWNDPLKLLWTLIVFGFLVLLGFILLIIPGIIASAFWMYSPYVTVDTGEWGWSALKNSREIMRGRTWDSLGLIFLSSTVGVIMIIPILGSIAYFIYSVITFPINAVRYQSLLDLKKQPEWSSVPVSKWNYAVIIIGVIFGGQQNLDALQKLQQNAAQVENINKAY